MLLRGISILLILLPSLCSGYANERIDSLLRIVDNELSDSIKVNAFNELGSDYRHIDDSLAILYSQKAIDLSLKINYRFGEADGYRMMGIHYLVYRNYKESEKYLLKAIDKFTLMDSIANIGNCYLSLGTVFSLSGEYDKAYEYIELSKQNFEKANDLFGVASSYRNFGILEAYQNNYTTAIEYFQKALNINEELGDLKSMADVYNNIGVIYNWQGNHDKSHEYQEKSLDASRQLGDSTSIAIGLLNLGVSYGDQGKYDKALSYYFEALQAKSNIDDKPGISMCLNNIGEVYKEKGDYSKAIEYYEKSLNIDKQLDDEEGIAICLLNIGTVHFKQNNYLKANEYYNESYEIAKKINSRKIMAYLLNSQGEALIKLKKYKPATEYFKNSIKLSHEIGDVSEKARSHYHLGQAYLKLIRFDIAIKYLNKALELHIELGERQDEAKDYKSLGEAWYQLGNFAKSAEYGLKSLEIGEEIEAKEIVRDAAQLLQKAYARQENFEKAYRYSIVFKQAHDSLFNIESQKQINLVENRFEFERQNQEIILNKAQLEKQDAELKKNSILQQALFGGIISIIIIVVLVFIGFFRERIAKRVITEQKVSIEETNEEMNQANEELRVTLNTISHQNKKMEKVNQKITDSIHYAKYIQKAILPKEVILNKLLKNYFVLYKPKDIVSGDFYWITELEGRTIVAAADCTGHGVPGGFMSMLGVSFLNDIINKEYITHSGVILRRLRKEVVNALQQKGEIGEQRDGMDIALCSIDYKTLEMQFSGAHNPLYIIRDKNSTPIDGALVIEGENHNLYEIKGDRMPIALYEKMDRFKTIEIQLLKGDLLYLFSDGYADQFGGKLGKRLKYKPFKNQILENCTFSMNEQKRLLNQNFSLWKQGYEQIDDVLVLGFEIT